MGKPLRVIRAESPLALTRPIVVKEDQLIHVTGTKALRRRDYQIALINYFRILAQKEFAKTMSEQTIRMGTTFKRLRISHARSRWGSCSSSGTISLNWQLIRLPQDISEYVIIHELAHTIHMNHSRDFWNLVAHYCDDYKRKRAFLRHISLHWGYSFWAI